MAWPAPSHYLNQCWIIVNWTLRNKLQSNLNQNSKIFIQENAFESVVCETAAILSRPQYVNGLECWLTTWTQELGCRICIASILETSNHFVTKHNLNRYGTGPWYFREDQSIPWLLMPWLLLSPSLPLYNADLRETWISMIHLSVEYWYKCKYLFMSLNTYSPQQGLSKFILNSLTPYDNIDLGQHWLR